MHRSNTKAKGRHGEEKAVEYLRTIGYRIVDKNYRNCFGEIDIIAKDGETIVFIEVKARHTDSFGHPVTAIDMRKQERIGKVAAGFIAEKKITNQPCRFDVVSIYNNRIELIKNAFELMEGLTW